MITVRRAVAPDVDSIFKLTSAMAKRGFMLPRSKYKIVTMLCNFYVAEDDAAGVVVGCGAFNPLWTDMGEIMALAVLDEYQNRGVGKRLVEALIDEGRRLEMPQMITLTYQTDFFSKLGFIETDKDQFPRKLWRECLECPKLEECDEVAMQIFLD
jgi:amino-acid N-acetyltransferase